MRLSEHHLVVLEEESIEIAREAMDLGQRCSKALRFGLDEVQAGHVHSNIERIEVEIRDLVTIAHRLVRAGVLSPECLTPCEAKEQRITAAMAYSAECGTLEDVDA